MVSPELQGRGRNEKRIVEYVDSFTPNPKWKWYVASYSGMVDYPRIPITGKHLGNFLDSTEFQSWKVNFKNQVCTRTADLQITMHWVEIVISLTKF